MKLIRQLRLISWLGPMAFTAFFLWACWAFTESMPEQPMGELTRDYAVE